jgi:hypothetical protein
MIRKLALALLALALSTIPTHAQTAPLAITINSSTSSPHSCGRVSYPLYCYGIPISVNGTAGTVWLDAYYQANSGFALFNVQNPDGTYAFLSTANITGVTTVLSTVTFGTHTSMQITSIKVGLSFIGDPDSDGDDDSSTAVMTLNFTYSYGCSGGRGYSCFWVRNATDGLISTSAALN